MTISGSGAGFSTLVIVSPMVMPSTPATATMSPIVVSVVSVRLRPLKVKSLVMRVFNQAAVALGDIHIVAGVQRALKDAANGDAAKVIGVVEVRYQNLQRSIGIARRRGNRRHNRLKERLQIFARHCWIGGRLAQLGHGVQHREIQLISSASRSMKRS